MKDRKDFIDRFLKLLFGDRVSEVDSSIIVKLAKDPAVLKACMEGDIMNLKNLQQQSENQKVYFNDFFKYMESIDKSINSIWEASEKIRENKNIKARRA